MPRILNIICMFNLFLYLCASKILEQTVFIHKNAIFLLFVERIILSNSIPFLITQSVNNHFINYFGIHCYLSRI